MVKVTDVGNTTAYQNIQVEFTVTSGQAQLTSVNFGSPDVSTTLEARTSNLGLARAYIQLPNVSGDTSTITVRIAGLDGPSDPEVTATASTTARCRHRTFFSPITATEP